MGVTQAQLDSFYQLASDKIQTGDVDSPEELFDLWNLLNPQPIETKEINESIRRGMEDIQAGRGRLADDVTDELHRMYFWNTNLH